LKWKDTLKPAAKTEAKEREKISPSP